MQRIAFKGTTPKYLVIDLDKCSLPKKYCFEGVENRILLKKHDAHDADNKIRKQFPVNLLSGMTIHIVQG